MEEVQISLCQSLKHVNAWVQARAIRVNEQGLGINAVNIAA